MKLLYTLLFCILCLFPIKANAEELRDILVSSENTTEIVSDVEAIVSDDQGEHFRGTFDECMAYIQNTGTELTVVLQKDISYTDVEWTISNRPPLTIDLNGHNIDLTSTNRSEKAFYVLNASVTVTDTNTPIEVTTVVDEKVESSYDKNTKQLVYTTAEVDENLNTYLLKHDVDCSNYGSISSTGYMHVFMVANGSLIIDQGLFSGDIRFLYSVWAVSKIIVNGGYFYGFGDINTGCGVFYVLSGETLTCNGGTIINCRANSGAAITCHADLVISGLTITDSYAAWASMIEAYNNVDISGLHISLCSSRRAVCITASNATINISGIKFLKNTCTESGIINAMNVVNVALSNVLLLDNICSTSDTLMSISSADVTLSNFTSFRNVAKSTISGFNTIKVKDKIIVQDEGGGIVLPQDTVIQIEDDISQESLIDVTAEKIPTAGNDVPIVSITAPWLTTVLNNFVSKQGYYIVERDKQVFLSVTDPDDFNIRQDCVTCQYYAWLPRVVRNSTEGMKLDLIDTRGGNMPKNVATLPTMNMYMGSNGRILISDSLLQLFSDQYFNESGVLSIDECAAVFANMNYEISELWYPKQGINLKSTDPDDWNIVDYTPGHTINAPNGTLVRIVCKPIATKLNTNVVFYDYDITDGGYYLSYDDVANRTNQVASVNMGADLEAGKVLHLRTDYFGINSLYNYADDGRAKLAFGNGNIGVKWQDESYTDGTLQIKINQINRGASGLSTFKGASYCIAKELDENGFIVYNENLDVPLLFNEGPAVGKSIYRNYQLQWDREGDMYTLAAVVGAEPYCQSLRTFVNPSPTAGTVYTNIWTNDFWPLDAAPSANGYGHDITFGEYKYVNQQQITFLRDDHMQRIPISDCGHSHNAYFGMQFSMSFTIPERYTGPLEYQFFGDDDMWVFLDNKLICDIGGIHSALGEFVNLWDYIGKDDHEEHTLSVYFMERGASGSTCWIRFYLPDAMPVAELFTGGSHSFTKTDADGNILPGATFGMYSDMECERLLSTVVSDEQGVVKFTDLAENATYFVKETAPPDSSWLLDDTIYVLKQNAYQVWFMYKLGDSSASPVTSVQNAKFYQPVMPNTGGSRLLYGLFAFLLTFIAGCFMLYLRRQLRE